MSRCVCCNNILLYGELKRKKKDEQPEDMCSRCLRDAMYPVYQPDKQLCLLTDMDVLNKKFWLSYSE